MTHRASRLLWGRSRLSHAQRVTHLAASQSRSFGVVRQRPLHPVREKGRTRIKASAVQSQDGNLPRFMMSRASKASWTSMPNSVMILVSLTVAPSWLRRCPEKKKLLIEVFPFRGLLIVGGWIASKSLDRCLQCGKVNGAPVSDAMEVLEGTSEWPVPEREMANHKDSP